MASVTHKNEQIVLSWDEWMAAKILADFRMKANNGHQFETILKTRCVHCGRSPKARGRCGQWFQSFIGRLDTILLNTDRERLYLRRIADLGRTAINE